ncbi:uncharacterized protein LOC115222505 isoform X3 [Octopus sinensis]|uniref:Uncharacterized protein LOC115222505 isoform X3 n=1 Tax=Octopus sinensis TaxID=2607531 RepID=A0A7E6FJD6_9MOLL|nr:uncharacterized protein LOC115222505 isoform X3 [Octopus sinensis]
MAFQLPDKLDASRKLRQSFIPAPKVYSKTAQPKTCLTIENQETISYKTNTAVDEKPNTSKQFNIGDRVCISGQKQGTLLYFGKLHVSDGLWCGIELELPEGSHNGKIEDVRYFTCKKFHGIFAPIDKVERVIPSKPLTTWAKVKESSVYDERNNELQKDQSVTNIENHEEDYPVKHRSEGGNVNFWRKTKPQIQDQNLSETHSLENQVNHLETHPSLANKGHDNSDHHTPWQQFLKSHGSPNSYVQSQHIQNQSKSPPQSQQLKAVSKECESSSPYTSGHSIPLHSSRTTGSTQQLQNSTASSYSDQQQSYSRLQYQPQQQYSGQQFKPQQYQRNSIPHQYQQQQYQQPQQQQHQQFSSPHSHHQSLHFSPQQQYDTSSLPPQQLYLHETQQPGHQYPGHHYPPQQQQYPPHQQQYPPPQPQQYLPQQQYPPPPQQSQQYPLPPHQHQYPPAPQQQPYASPPQQQQYPPLSLHQQQQYISTPPPHQQQYSQPPHHQQQYPLPPHLPQQQLYASPPPPPQHSSKSSDHSSCLPEERSINEEKDNGSTQADMGISACVKEYLESDRRTYFNFTFDAENSGNVRTASNKPNSLTSSLYQAERELDPAGVIWELENTDDEISFRIDSEKTSESSSLATSTDEKQLTSKLESGSPINSKLALTENKMAESEALLIKQLEEELASNIVERGTESEKGSSEEDEIIITNNKDKKNKLLINVEKAVEHGVNSLHGGHITLDMKSSLDSQFSDITSDRTPPIMTDSGIMVDSRISDFGRYKCSSMENSLDMDHLHTSDQLAADLQDGHREKNRPTSLISTTSVDTGYADTESCIMASPLNTEDMKALINTEEQEEIEGDSVKKLVLEPLESALQSDPSKDICTNENDSLVKIEECQRNEDDIIPENKEKELNLSENGKEAETVEKIDVECESSVKVSATKEVNKIAENRVERRASSTEKSTKNAANKVKATRTRDLLSRSAERKADSPKPAAVPEAPRIKRERPKSKWDKIMNKIENNKESIKLKTKSDVKSTIGSYVQQKPTVIKEPKPVKEIPKVTHIPQPDYSKVKSKLFSATASTSTKQKISLKATNKVTNNLKTRRDSTKSVASSTSTLECSSDHQSEDKVKKEKDAKSQKKPLGSKTSLRSGSISSLKGSTTAQPTSKSMNTKNPSTWTNDKNVINKSLTIQSTPKKISSSKTPSTGKINVTNNVTKDKKSPALKHSSHQVDQNKVSKTTRNKVPSLKTSQGDNKDVKKEITRLEGLCESRTKDLHITKLQLKETLKGFDAMSVLVNYLAFELDAFTNFSLKEKFGLMKEELTETKKELENLNDKQKSLTKEIEDINAAHEKALSLLVTTHNTTLMELKEKLNEKHMQELSRQAEKWQNDKEKYKQQVEEKNKDIDSEHQQELSSLRLRNLEEIRTLQRKHDDQMERLHQQHRDKLAEITNTFETIKMSLSNKVESLCEECDKLRKRAAVCEENLEKEVDVRIHNALEVYNHLPQEIDSLKAVIDMKNTEIQNLNKENGNLRTQAAEIQPALEKITLLQQKIENLEAILQIKTDHEKQLNEKCQSLMRKFNKENRANKRMSMEFDKLKWHMSQSDLSGSQENILKMYSCSPSGSESGSPDPTQRFSRSPKHWDYDDTSGDQLSMSVSCDGSNELKTRRRVDTFLVTDRISPQNSPKYKSNSVRMSQSWTTSDDQTDLFTSTQSTNTDTTTTTATSTTTTTTTTTHAYLPSPAESTKPISSENSDINTCPTKEESSST